MEYMFPGLAAHKLNTRPLKLSSKTFYCNQEQLSEKYQKLNYGYYLAYLTSVAYQTYRHLFGLAHYMRKTDDPNAWLNSLTAISYFKFNHVMFKLRINPVRYLSTCFSSFYHQAVVYHQVYDYMPSQLLDGQKLVKFKRQNNHKSKYFKYYFMGNPVLDVVSRFFDDCLEYDNPFKSFLSEIKYNWVSYLNESEKLLRMDKLPFKMYFKHDRTKIETRACFSYDWLNVIKLLGIPDDSQAFGFLNDRVWRYTQGYTKNLIGYEEFMNNRLEIPKYRLYSVNVAREILQVMSAWRSDHD